MSYVRTPALGAVSRRSPRRAPNRALGFFLVDDLLAIAGAVKGITSIASSASTFFDTGKSTDQRRMARENYFEVSAKAGSVTAMQYMLGALGQVAGNERPYYVDGIARVRNDSTGIGEQVYQAAMQRGAKWATGIPDPQGTQGMFDDVKADLAAIGAATSAAPTPTTYNAGSSFPTSSSGSPAGSSGSAQHPVTLPAVTTTAPFNYTPWIIGGAVGLALLTMRNR